MEATADKHPSFAEQLEQRDAEIFMAIPALLVLKCIEQDDKAICEEFFPDIKEPQSHEGTEVAQLRVRYEDM